VAAIGATIVTALAFQRYLVAWGQQSLIESHKEPSFGRRWPSTASSVHLLPSSSENCSTQWPESRIPRDEELNGRSLSASSLLKLGWEPLANGTRSWLFRRGQQVLKLSQLGWPDCSYSLGVTECAALNFVRCQLHEGCPSESGEAGVPICFALSRATFDGSPVHVARISHVRGVHVDEAFRQKDDPHLPAVVAYHGLEMIHRFQTLGVSHRDIDSSNVLISEARAPFFIDFALATLPSIPARGAPRLELGRAKPPDALSCGYDDAYSFLSTLRGALRASRWTSVPRGLLAVFRLALAPDCRKRMTDPARLLRLLDSFGFVDERIAPCFAANEYAQVPKIKAASKCVVIEGYQQFTACAADVSTDVAYLNVRGAAILRHAHLSNATLIDIGGNAGYFTWLAVDHGASWGTIVEADPAAIAAGQRVQQLGSLRRTATQYRPFKWLTSTPPPTADVVLALAIVHWLFSCSETLGSLADVVSFLRSLTAQQLFIEWIDPQDPAISGFHHTLEDPSYTRQVFEEALRHNFATYEVVAHSREYRDLYLASVHPPTS